MQRSKFQKIVVLFLTIAFSIPSYAQYKYKYTSKGVLSAGMIVPHSKNLDSIAKGMVLGGEIAFEWAAQSKNRWQQFWRFPNVGIGLGFVNLGNNQLLGNAVYLYPYISIPMFTVKDIDINLKLGAGLSYVTKTWNDADTLSGVDASTANSAFSFPLNCYLTSSINFEYLLTDQIALIGDLGYAHMSNGSFRNPNFGVNMGYVHLGARYKFSPHNPNLSYNPAYALPFDFEGKVVASGFSREIHYNDHKSFFVGSLHAGITFPIDGWYTLGGGADLFYDGAFTKRPSEANPMFNRYRIEEDMFANKIRFGISVNNEFVMGRLTGIVDLGIYLYDPLRNAYPHVTESRGIFYKYNLKKEDGWNYTRFALRYRVYDNFVVQAGIKTHGYIAEMLEVGVGYLLPFARPKYDSLKKSSKSYRFFRYDRKEPPAYPTPWVE